MRAPPSAVRALASSARAPTCRAMATASSAGPLASSKRSTTTRQLRERAEHPRPLRRRLGRHQPHGLLLLAERVRVPKHVQVAGELLVEQPGPLRLARLVDQRQGLADQLRGPGGVAGRIGRLGAARQQRHPVHTRALHGIRDLIPQPQHPLQLQLRLGKGIHPLGSGGRLDAGGQGARLVPGRRPVVGQPRRPARRSVPGLQAGLQGAGQRGVQPDPLASQQLPVDRLGHQRMAEHIALAAGLGQQQLLVDRLAQALQQLWSSMPVTAASSGWVTPGPAAAATPSSRWVPEPSRTTRVSRTSCRLGGSTPGSPPASSSSSAKNGLPRSGRRGRRSAGWAGVAEQAGQLLGQLGAGEALQLQPVYAAVAGQLAQQPP